MGDVQDAGASIGKGNPKSDLDWTIYRAKQLPGPGAYNVSIFNNFLNSCITGAMVDDVIM